MAADAADVAVVADAPAAPAAACQCQEMGILFNRLACLVLRDRESGPWNLKTLTMTMTGSDVKMKWEQ